ncbi:MAG: hypothetical protein MI743_21465 [Sneathiellales bacterium]|nr:hypothetical protein [Sneathiellales bacterium]
MTLEFSQAIQTLNIFEICGVMGFLAYLASFAFLQLGFIDGNGACYPSLKILAAILVLISLTDAFNLAAALTQISFILIGVTGLALRFLGLRRKNWRMRGAAPDEI